MNGAAFRTLIFPNGDGTRQMMVNKTMQAAGAAPGDTVAVVMERDDEPRETVVPKELFR